MLSSLGYPEMGVLLLFGLFVFGPERLPGMAKDLGRFLRQIRTYGKAMRDDLASEMGPEFGDLDLRSLHPRTFVRKHLLEDEPPTAPAFQTPPDSTPASPTGDTTPPAAARTQFRDPTGTAGS